MTDRHIWAVNVLARAALTNDDRLCTITNMFDDRGEETNDPTEAVAAVAQLDDETWFSIDLRQFDKVQAN